MPGCILGVGFADEVCVKSVMDVMYCYYYVGFSPNSMSTLRGSYDE